MNNIRKGKGFSWAQPMSGAHGTIREISGFTIDNLDQKQLLDANDNYEKIFILIRQALEKNDARRLDNEGERLQVCQDIADTLRERKLIK